MKKNLLVLGLLWTISLSMCAQSVEYAKSLINQGKYLEAAKQLRPLADGGNAEAQAIASYLFFEGKGVQKNEQQGLKYATLAANQGYEGGVSNLCNYYEKKGDRAKAISIAKNYTDKFPQLLKGKLGWTLGERYVYAENKENEDRGWEILTEHPHFKESLENNDYFAQAYWDYQRRKSNCLSLDDLAEKHFSSGLITKGHDIIDYIITSRYSNKEKALSEYKKLADQGNSFAKANYARLITENGRSPDRFKVAKELSEQAKNEGSAYGAYLYKTYKDLHYVGENLKDGVAFWVSSDGMIAKIVSHESFSGKKYECKKQLDNLNKRSDFYWREPRLDEYYQISSAYKTIKPYYSFDTYMWGYSYPGNYRNVSGTLVVMNNINYNSRGRMNCVSYLSNGNIRYPNKGTINMSTRYAIKAVVVSNGRTYIEIICINNEKACNASVSNDAYLLCNGKKYKLLSSDIPVDQVSESYWLIFEGIPNTWSQFDLVDSRYLRVTGIS